jgi:hypothetical protein
MADNDNANNDSGVEKPSASTRQVRLLKGMLFVCISLLGISVYLNFAPEGTPETSVELTQEEEPWEPNATTLLGVSLGESQSDVIFRRGEPINCLSIELNGESCLWGDLQVVFFDGAVGMVASTATGGSTARRALNIRLSRPLFTTIEEMKEILGEEDIYASSGDFLTRRYTYLEWGVTYTFASNQVEDIMIGRVNWRTGNGVSEYVVQGRVVCPSDDCPWDDEGELKPEYEDKDYRVFLPQ